MAYPTAKDLDLTFVSTHTVSSLTPKQQRSLWWSIRIAKKRGLLLHVGTCSQLVTANLSLKRQDELLVTDVRQIGQFFFVQLFGCLECRSDVTFVLSNELNNTNGSTQLLDQTRRCPLLESLWYIAMKR